MKRRLAWVSDLLQDAGIGIESGDLREREEGWAGALSNPSI